MSFLHKNHFTTTGIEPFTQAKRLIWSSVCIKKKICFSVVKEKILNFEPRWLADV